MVEKPNYDYLSDKAVDNKEQDAFQRFNFAQRIVEIIKRRKSSDSIVIGIYGAWGEGKTSVLNFIRNEVKKTKDEYIQIDFNPWRFTDEAALLTSFFNSLGEAVLASNNDKERLITEKRKWISFEWFNRQREPLKTNIETIGDLIKKYGKVTAIFGAGEAANAIGEAISNVNIDELKSRIESLLSNSGKKILIYIDDIDRLDRSEIHSIFRLVKLTGDFTNTIYILSFDQEMVSEAIGERFGSGDKKAGHNFLEKIIQIPLNIPVAAPSSLREYCFKLIDSAIQSSDIVISSTEIERFVYNFTSYVFSRLTTPRLAVRYSNTIAFSLPLLEGEVNYSDLLLIESIRVFFPSHYLFIKNNPEFFIEDYKNTYDNNLNKEKVELYQLRMEELNENLTSTEIDNIRSLLIELFPLLESVYGYGYYSQGSKEDWSRDQRIASTKYFKRYFTYSVIKGEVSDNDFRILIKLAEDTKSSSEYENHFKEMIENSNPENLIHKINEHSRQFNWNAGKQISKSLCNYSHILSEKGGILNLGHGSPFGLAALSITKIIESHGSNDESFEFSKLLMTYPPQFSFAYAINNWLRGSKVEGGKLFSDDQYVELAQIITDRAISESGEDSIFEIFPKYIGYLTQTWHQRDSAGLFDYIDSYLNKDKKNVIKFLRSFVPLIHSSAKSEPYLEDLTSNHYKYIVSIYDNHKIVDFINHIIPIDELKKKEVYWVESGDNEYDDMNLLRQFIHWNEKQSNN
ncbi:MAG: KAP family NTPase [Balneolia bacterium]|nr:KAP family NTPase [Balneolia bacterium]